MATSRQVVTPRRVGLAAFSHATTRVSAPRMGLVVRATAGNVSMCGMLSSGTAARVPLWQLLARAPAEPSNSNLFFTAETEISEELKTLEIMRKFSEQYAKR